MFYANVTLFQICKYLYLFFFSQAGKKGNSVNQAAKVRILAEHDKGKLKEQLKKTRNIGSADWASNILTLI